MGNAWLAARRPAERCPHNVSLPETECPQPWPCRNRWYHSKGVGKGRRALENKATIWLAFAVGGLVAFFSAHANAQGRLPPYEAITIVRSMGMAPLSRPVRQGAAYILRAVDGYGEEVTVTVDARQGRVLSVQPVVPVAGPYGPPGQAYIPPPYSVEPPYVPEAEPYYPDGEVEFEPGYEPLPPREPRVIYAPRASYDVPRPLARVPAKVSASQSKSKARSNPPKPVDANPAERRTTLTTGSVLADSEAVDTSSVPAIPPVQSLE
jgi:hypothetical protein